MKRGRGDCKGRAGRRRRGGGGRGRDGKETTDPGLGYSSIECVGGVRCYGRGGRGDGGDLLLEEACDRKGHSTCQTVEL